MEQKYIWPLVGVFIGWVLTSLTARWKAKEEARRAAGRLLYKLLWIHHQIKTMQSACDNFKDQSENWTEFEAYRSLVSARHFLEPPGQIDALIESIEEVSSLYPVDCQGMHALVDLLLANKKASISAFLDLSEQAYIKILSMYEVNVAQCRKEIERNCRWLAYKHGMITRIKVYFLLRREISEKNFDFLSGFSKGLNDDVRDALNKRLQPNANASAE